MGEMTMNRMLIAAVCFVGGGLAVGLTGAVLAQDRATEQEKVAREAEAKQAAANDAAAKDAEAAEAKRIAKAASRVSGTEPVSDGVSVIEKLNADQIRARIAELEVALVAAEKDGAEKREAEVRAELAEFRGMLKRAEKGEVVWRMKPDTTEMGKPRRERDYEAELDELLRRLDTTGPSDTVYGEYMEPGMRMYQGPVFAMGAPDAFKIVECSRLNTTLMIDTRNGKTWWLDKSSRGVGFEWKLVEREGEMPAPQPMPRLRRMAEMPRGDAPDSLDRTKAELEAQLKKFEEASRKLERLEKELERQRREVEDLERADKPEQPSGR
jgi:hypothetical protein